MNQKYTLHNWDQIIGYIKNWQNGCIGFEGEEYEAPTIKSIDRTIKFAEKCLIWKVSIPDRVTPTGDGGITFEWGESKDAKVYEFDEGGNLETYKFEDNKLVDRRQL